jgi:hypothetical protein
VAQIIDGVHRVDQLISIQIAQNQASNLDNKRVSLEK